MVDAPASGFAECQEHVTGEAAAWWQVRVWPVGVGPGEDVGELGEAEAARVERVEVVLQRPVMVVNLDAGFPQAAIGADRAGVAESKRPAPAGQGWLRSATW